MRALLLFFVLCSCAPESSPRERVVLNGIAESDRLQFPAKIDDAGVRLLSGDGGRSIGKIDAPEDEADTDVIEISATPGKLLRLTFLPGSGQSLRPLLSVTDERGKVLGLRDGSIERQALLQIVVPTQARVFVVLQDARNVKEGARLGGVSFDYTLTLSEEDLTPTPISGGVVTSSLFPDGLQLFSLPAAPGQRVSIIVDPAVLADPAFVPFVVVYTASFDLGVTFAAELPLQTLRGDFTVFGDRVLFGVSDFSGELGNNYSFDLSVQVTP